MKSSRHHRRHAFTLMEMLLVLAVIVAVSAMAAPMFRGVLDAKRLSSGGEHVRANMAKAKNRAMRSGRIYVFRYELGGNKFYMQPWYSDEDVLEASPTSSAIGGVSGGAFVDPFQAPEFLEELPESVVFVGGDSLSAMRDMSVEQDIAAAGGFVAGWSRPILFYPDGSSSTARIVLQNHRDDMVTVSLRGLTGIATASDVTSPDATGMGVLP
ncbi:MAG: prepilin-type N-terminal cleavage/methylation domain-containing protein [Pirellulaceae bacterium]